jgi:hypothetical protein
MSAFSSKAIEYAMKQTAELLIETLSDPQNDDRDTWVKAYIEILMRYYLLLEDNRIGRVTDRMERKRLEQAARRLARRVELRLQRPM